MDVTVTTLRAELAEWIKRAREGEEVVVTERGRPVARLSGVSTTPLLDDLVASGVVEPPRGASKPVARTGVRVSAAGPVADLIGELRR